MVLDNKDNEADSSVSCTTEKGRHKCKNHKTVDNEQMTDTCWLQEELLRRPQVTKYQPALASHTQLTNRTDHPHSDHNDEPQIPM